MTREAGSILSVGVPVMTAIDSLSSAHSLSSTGRDAPPAGRTHTIDYGDTVSAVAQRYGVETGEQLRRGVDGYLSNLIESVKRWFREVTGKAMSDADVYELLEGAWRYAENAGRGRAFGAGANQRAYHGSPRRDIDRFSTQFMGTGEGNQAFGWGMYFASKREVAAAETMFRMERIPTLSTTHTSIEEISSKVLGTLGLQREMF